MLFDQVRELPVATVRHAPRARLDILLGHLQQWMEARWGWLRPRMIPLAVAAIGTVAVVHAVDYLARPLAVGSNAAVNAGAVLYVDGAPPRDGVPLTELSTPGYRVHIVVPPQLEP